MILKHNNPEVINTWHMSYSVSMLAWTQASAILETLKHADSVAMWLDDGTQDFIKSVLHSNAIKNAPNKFLTAVRAMYKEDKYSGIMYTAATVLNSRKILG